MLQAANVIDLPVRDAQRDRLVNGPASIHQLHDYFAAPPEATLEEAKARLRRELPPKPDVRGMEEWQAVSAIWDWVRMQNYVYQTVLGI